MMVIITASQEDIWTCEASPWKSQYQTKNFPQIFLWFSASFKAWEWHISLQVAGRMLLQITRKDWQKNCTIENKVLYIHWRSIQAKLQNLAQKTVTVTHESNELVNWYQGTISGQRECRDNVDLSACHGIIFISVEAFEQKKEKRNANFIADNFQLYPCHKWEWQSSDNYHMLILRSFIADDFQFYHGKLLAKFRQLTSMQILMQSFV